MSLCETCLRCGYDCDYCCDRKPEEVECEECAWYIFDKADMRGEEE